MLGVVSLHPLCEGKRGKNEGLGGFWERGSSLIDWEDKKHRS